MNNRIPTMVSLIKLEKLVNNILSLPSAQQLNILSQL